MLILFDFPADRILALANYSKLHNHLEYMEKTRGKGKWVFAQHPHQRVLSFYRYVRAQKLLVLPTTSGIFERSLEEALKQTERSNAPEKEGGKNFDILEIVDGKKPVLIPVTPDVDVEALQKQWCRNYCKTHGYALFEVSSPADFKEIGGGHDHVVG
jgi:hypothetical protein